MKKAYILDSGAFISGIDFEDGDFYTLPEVIEELRQERASLRARVGLEAGKLAVVSSTVLDDVEEAARETGDIDTLSRTDLKLLSLGLTFKEEGREALIVTDDYAVQNVAQRLGIGFAPAAEKGIKRALVWRKVCRGCGRVYPPTHMGDCTFCGSRVKRRIYRGSRQ
jgi:UPF0271 protein